MPNKKYATDEERKLARANSAKKYRENNPDKYKAAQERFKINNPLSQKISQNKSYQKHKDRKIKYQKERRKVNRDIVLSSERKWYRNNKDKKSKYQKEYIKRNRALITQRRREYVKNNLEYIRELSRVHTIKRRALKSNLSEYFSRLSVIQVYYKFDYKCFHCKSIDRLSIDHHYPLSLGNPLTINNAVLLCRSCNAKKGTKLPETFYSPEQLTDLQLNYGISKSPIEEKQPSLFEARMPKNLERDNGLFGAMNAA